MSDTLKRAAAMLLAEANAIEDCHTRGDGDWTGEDEAKASHDAMREVAILLGEEAERMAEQAFFLKAAQAESERYCEQRDMLLPANDQGKPRAEAGEARCSESA